MVGEAAIAVVCVSVGDLGGVDVDAGTLRASPRREEGVADLPGGHRAGGEELSTGGGDVRGGNRVAHEAPFGNDGAWWWRWRRCPDQQRSPDGWGRPGVD